MEGKLGRRPSHGQGCGPGDAPALKPKLWRRTRRGRDAGFQTSLSAIQEGEKGTEGEKGGAKGTQLF
jgi:hypothetical protein